MLLPMTPAISEGGRLSTFLMPLEKTHCPLRCSRGRGTVCTAASDDTPTARLGSRLLRLVVNDQRPEQTDPVEPSPTVKPKLPGQIGFQRQIQFLGQGFGRELAQHHELALQLGEGREEREPQQQN